MRVQMKIVLNPLGKLKEAMEKFSSGDIDIRLQEDSSSVKSKPFIGLLISWLSK